MREIGHFIGGKEVKGTSGRFGDVFNPNTGEVQAKVALAKRRRSSSAIANREGGAARPGRRPIRSAAPASCSSSSSWSRRSTTSLARAALLASTARPSPTPGATSSAGSRWSNSPAASRTCSRASITEGAGPGIDLYSMRQPLGVVAGITPFNFPAMIPMWKFAPALACGNAFILKPSERDPSVPMRLAELLIEAGLPAGVLNVVNGDKEAVDTLLDRSARRRRSASSARRRSRNTSIRTGTAHGKRVQCFGGAKNHMIVMPDADMDQAVDALIGAGYGSAGERCMAISVAVPVGKKTADALVEKLIPRVESLKIGPSTDPQADYGPLVTRAHLDKVKELCRSRHQGRRQAHGRRPRLQDAGLRERLLHGRLPVRRGDARRCASTRRRSSARCSRWCAPRTTRRRCGCRPSTNTATASRSSRATATPRATSPAASKVGMVGVNFAIPVPLAYHTFGGWKRSGFGDLNQHGPDSIRFYTKTKTVTSRWPSGTKEGAEFVIPTMK